MDVIAKQRSPNIFTRQEHRSLFVCPFLSTPHPPTNQKAIFNLSKSQFKKNCGICKGKINGRNKGMGLFDLEKHFAFYGAYHSNPVNIVVHMIFVWPIAFTTLVLLYFTPPLFKVSAIESLNENFLVFNYGFLFTVIYALYYVGLDKKAGSLAAALFILCWIGSSALAHSLGFSLAWKVVLASQLLCWTSQFIGHGVFEKRAPALLDNLAQAFLMAPFFVLLEALQSAFGYEPYPGFHDRVKAKIDAEIKEWKDKKQKKIS